MRLPSEPSGVAGLVEELARLVEVEGERVGVVQLQPVVGVGRRDDRGAGLAAALVDRPEQLLAVDGEVQGEPERRVEHGGVGVAHRLAGLEVDRAGVEGDLVEARRVSAGGRDAVLALERLDLERREVVDEVDLALDQRLHRGVRALEDPEGHLVDVRRTVPVVGVGLELVGRAAGGALDQPEGTGADHGLAVRRLGRVALDVLLGDVLPDVLGDDRDRQQRQHGVRLLQGEHDRRGVGSLDRLDALEVRRPGRRLGTAVEDAAVGVGDVGGGQRLAVGPHRVVAHREGPGEAVVGGVPLGGQRGCRRHVLHRVADEVVVGQRPHLERRGLDAQERVERVDLVGQPDDERHRVVLGGLRRRGDRSRKDHRREEGEGGGDAGRGEYVAACARAPHRWPPGRATRAPRPRPARRHPPGPLRVDVPRRRRAPSGAAGAPGGRARVVRRGDESSVLLGLGGPLRDGGEGSRGETLGHLVANALFLLHPRRQGQGLHRHLARKS